MYHKVGIFACRLAHARFCEVSRSQASATCTCTHTVPVSTQYRDTIAHAQYGGSSREYGAVSRLPSTLFALFSSENRLHWRSELRHSRQGRDSSSDVTPAPPIYYVRGVAILYRFALGFKTVIIFNPQYFHSGSGILLVFEESPTGFREVVRSISIHSMHT